MGRGDGKKPTGNFLYRVASRISSPSVHKAKPPSPQQKCQREEKARQMSS